MRKKNWADKPRENVSIKTNICFVTGNRAINKL